MVYTAISLFIVSLLFLIIGLINPDWVFFWQKKPERLMVAAVGGIMLMGSVTLYGEGLRRKQETEETVGSKPPIAEAPIPQETDIPTPIADKPKALKPTE